LAPFNKERINLSDRIFNHSLTFIIRSKSFINSYARLINIIKTKKTLNKVWRVYYNWTNNKDGITLHGYEWNNSLVYNESISLKREALRYYKLDEYTFINIINCN
jgi:hypothetical protein